MSKARLVVSAPWTVTGPLSSVLEQSSAGRTLGLGSWTALREEPESPDRWQEGARDPADLPARFRGVFTSVPRTLPRALLGISCLSRRIFLSCACSGTAYHIFSQVESEGTSAFISGKQANFKPHFHISDKHLSNLWLLHTTRRADASRIFPPPLRCNFLYCVAPSEVSLPLPSKLARRPPAEE